MVKKLLEKILPPEETIFYNCFEEATHVCKDTARLFQEIMHQGIDDERLTRAKTLKHKSNDIAKQTLIHLNNTFITPIDREDIQAVASLLNKITRKIVKASFNLRTYRLAEHTSYMKEQADTLVKATDELENIISMLRKVSVTKDVCESHQRMKEIETHGDEILHNCMDELFSGSHDALSVIKLKDIYKGLESTLDACYSVSDEVVNIVLKHG